MKLGYLALEIKRAIRNPRFLIFTIGFPVVLFLLYVGIFSNGTPPAARPQLISGLMVSMTAFGAMTAALFTGGRVAVERASGWQRQLRLTPLSGGGYLGGKVAVSMLVALPPALLVPLIGALVEGVTLEPSGWLRVTLGVWLAALPFAFLGLVIGQLGTPETMQPISSVVMLTMSLLGGLFIPIEQLPSWLLPVSKILPSYWLVQTGRSAVTSHLTVGLGSVAGVLVVWTLALAGLVVLRYRRDSARA